jgi:hypothetical protein
MSFEEMKLQAAQLGYSLNEMRRNCNEQLAQYRRLSVAPGDKWDIAANRAAECLGWLERRE